PMQSYSSMVSSGPPAAKRRLSGLKSRLSCGKPGRHFANPFVGRQIPKHNAARLSQPILDSKKPAIGAKTGPCKLRTRLSIRYAKDFRVVGHAAHGDVSQVIAGGIAL